MLGEAAPLLSPQFDALLVSLLAIAGCIVALGLVTILHRFSRAVGGGVAGILAGIPGIGSVLSSPVNAVVHWLDHEFSQAEAALDYTLAFYLHNLGALVRWLGREVRGTAALLHTIAQAMIGPATIRAIHAAIGFARAEARRLDRLLSSGLHRLANLEHQVEHATVGPIAAAIHAIVRPIAHELDVLDRWTRDRIAGLEHAVGHAIPHDIAGLRSRARALEDGYSNLFARIRRLEHSLSTDAAVALVGVALAELGLEYVRCRNTKALGRAACGLPSDLLDALLTDALEALVVADICDVARVLEAGAVAFEPVLQGLVGLEGFVCSAGGADFPSAIVNADLTGGGELASGIVSADLAA